MRVILFCTIFLISSVTFSQQWKFLRNEVSVGLGTSHFMGELGGANNIGSSGIKGFKDLEFKLTRPAFSAGYRFYLNPMFAVKGDLTYARLNGDDALTTEKFRQNRNIHFRSPMIELSARIEFYPLKEYFGHLYRSNGVLGKSVNRLRPYTFIGVGGFWFNPKAKYEGNWVKLQPLQTEGVNYKKMAISMPFGVGLKYAITKQLSVGIEFALRYTSTDYIDDVSTEYVDKSSSDAMTQYLANPTINSIETFVDGTYVYNPTAPGMQRGDANNKDAFLLTLITVNYKFLKGKMNLPKF